MRLRLRARMTHESQSQSESESKNENENKLGDTIENENAIKLSSKIEEDNDNKNGIQLSGDVVVIVNDANIAQSQCLHSDAALRCEHCNTWVYSVSGYQPLTMKHV